MNVFSLGWKYYKNFWKKDTYADFKGRASRKEYWSTFLIYFLLTIPVSFISTIVRFDVSLFWAGIHIIPWSCLVIRRLHDTNKSGKWVIIYSVFGYFGLLSIFTNSITIITSLVHNVWPYLEPYIMYGDISNDAIESAKFYAYNALGSIWTLGLFAILWLAFSFITSLIIFIFTLLKGNPGSNRYGESPYALKSDIDSDKAEESKTNDSLEGVSTQSVLFVGKYNESMFGGNNMKIMRCSKCGKVICILSDSANPDIYCCGVVMNELKANTTDAAVEKHVPVVEKNGSIVSVKVGSAAHPMTAEHYIDWILLVGTKNVQIANVKGHDAAIASFSLSEGEDIVNVYSYCNLHGLWAIK